MHTLEADSEKTRRYWLREWRSIIGPCMVSFGVPLLIPGITITLVGFSDTSAIAAYSALHVIGILLLALGSLFVLIGIVFLVLACCCFNKVAPMADEPLRHVTTHDHLAPSKTSPGLGQNGGAPPRGPPSTSTPRTTTMGRSPRATTLAETPRTSLEGATPRTTAASRTAAISGGNSSPSVAAAVGSSSVPGEVTGSQGSPPRRSKSADSASSSASSSTSSSTSSSSSSTSDSSEDSSSSASSSDSLQRGKADWEGKLHPKAHPSPTVQAPSDVDASSPGSSTDGSSVDSASGSLSVGDGALLLPDQSGQSQSGTTALTLQSQLNGSTPRHYGGGDALRSARLPPITSAPVATVVGKPTNSHAASPLSDVTETLSGHMAFGMPEPLLRSGLDRPRLVQGLVQSDLSDVTSGSSSEDSEVTSEDEEEKKVVTEKVADANVLTLDLRDART